MVLALELIAFSLNMFFEPNKVAAGGATGIAILLYEGWAIPTSLSVFIINIIMLIFSYFHLDKVTTIKLTFGSFLLPILLFITPVYNLVPGNKILAIIIGSITFGIGLAVLYTLDMSSGGTTVPPMIIHKNFGIDKYISLFIIDGIVCLGNIALTGLLSFFLAVMSVAISSIAIKFCTVIEDKLLTE
ncbi:YitT family protein [Companilactobacillus insicii]|uniref:YitT family protein n=1 Tax=Companilactobacillus insicii TaxID=1732567 RepID=UPI0013DDEC55|nr:YitT family protein [Companilactobacillus insicii]